MHPIESYLHELHAIHASGAGVKETSYYPALKNLLDAVGQDLKPRVQCIIHLRSRGAGIPDGGLFTADQLKRGPEDPLAGQLPARAVIEVKGTGDEVRAVALSDQVARYLARYGLALVTNLRDFQLVRAGRGGRAELLESYRLAESEAAFWRGAASARRMSDLHGEAPAGRQAGRPVPRDGAGGVVGGRQLCALRLDGLNSRAALTEDVSRWR
jgi:hypothetical protein